MTKLKINHVLETGHSFLYMVVTDLISRINTVLNVLLLSVFVTATSANQILNGLDIDDASIPGLHTR